MGTVQVFKRLNIPSEKEHVTSANLGGLLARSVDEPPLVVEVTPTMFFLEIFTAGIMLHVADGHPSIIVPGFARNIAGAGFGVREKSGMFSNGTRLIQYLATHQVAIGFVVLAGGDYTVVVIDAASRFALGVEVMATSENTIFMPFKTDNPIMKVNSFENAIAFSGSRPGETGRGGVKYGELPGRKLSW